MSGDFDSPRSTASRRQLAELVLHLARRQLTSAHRFTLLGWLWPLARQLAQLAVLVFLFSNVLDLGIEHFATFVFAGLLVWSWFAAAASAATASIASGRHLVFSPRFPSIALPLVAVAVPLVDTLVALPVLLVMVALEGTLSPAVLVLPLLLALQFALTAGLVLITSALNVFVRDVQNLVGVGLLLLFYLTPVFYGLKSVPARFHAYLQLNPLTSLVTAVRDVLLEGRLPAAADVGRVLVASFVLLGIGVWLFRRLEPRFVDEL